MSDQAEEKAASTSTITQSSTVLLEDPFSPITRARQNLLLLASFVAILLSAAIIQPGEGEFLHIKFKLAHPAVATPLAGTVATYFLIIYVISCYLDLTSRYFKTVLSQSTGMSRSLLNAGERRLG